MTNRPEAESMGCRPAGDGSRNREAAVSSATPAAASASIRIVGATMCEAADLRGELHAAAAALKPAGCRNPAIPHMPMSSDAPFHSAMIDPAEIAL